MGKDHAECDPDGAAMIVASPWPRRQDFSLIRAEAPGHSTCQRIPLPYGPEVRCASAAQNGPMPVRTAVAENTIMRKSDERQSARSLASRRSWCAGDFADFPKALI